MKNTTASAQMKMISPAATERPNHAFRRRPWLATVDVGEVSSGCACLITAFCSDMAHLSQVVQAAISTYSCPLIYTRNIIT